MPRKPVHITAKIAVRTPCGEQGCWSVIRELRRFDRPLLVLRVQAHPTTVADYLRRLTLAGYVTRSDNAVYELVNDQPDAPRLRRDGTPAAEPGIGQEQMWRSMKMLGEFSPRELAAAASTDAARVTPTTAASYVKHLWRAGYLLCVAEARFGVGKAGAQARYRLKPSMNTGPLAPQVQRTDWVWDPNTRKALAPETQDQGGLHAER